MNKITDKQIEEYIKDMQERGIDKSLAQPWHDRLLGYCGLRLKPPLFRNFILNLLIISLATVIVFQIIRFICFEYLFKLVFPVIPICSCNESSYAVIALAILYGFFRAYQYDRLRKKLVLPSWKDYID